MAYNKDRGEQHRKVIAEREGGREGGGWEVGRRGRKGGEWVSGRWKVGGGEEGGKGGGWVGGWEVGREGERRAVSSLWL